MSAFPEYPPRSSGPFIKPSVPDQKQRKRWNFKVCDICSLLHTAPCVSYIDTQSKKPANSPRHRRSGDNSRRKLPDSSATSRFFALRKLLQCIIRIKIMQAFSVKKSAVGENFFRGFPGHLRTVLRVFSTFAAGALVH